MVIMNLHRANYLIYQTWDSNKLNNFHDFPGKFMQDKLYIAIKFKKREFIQF